MKHIEDYVRTIPDFPEPGIQFRDITSILQNPDGLKLSVDLFMEQLSGIDFDVIVGMESRGFLFGMPVAYAMGKPFVPIRKKGKLPCDTISAEYDLEYGTATIELHRDAIAPGQRVVLIDDLIATGGTIAAGARLVEQLGGKVVKIVCLIELKGLDGRKKMEQYDVSSIIAYEGK